MPELPEVETVRRGLAPSLVGARIATVEARRADIRFPLPPRFRQRLEGKRVLAVTRRAKYLLFALDSGETLIAHLGMSGSFRVDHQTPGDFHHPRSKDAKHDHIIFHLEGGKTITYNDPRRFGFMDLDMTAALHVNRHLKNLGAEPLSAEFDAALLATLFGGANAPLKTALLDQKRLVGLGNIYVCEALWRAGILPTRPAGVLANSQGGRADSCGEGLGPLHQGGSGRSDPGRRVNLARSSAGRWGARLFPAFLCGLRP